MSEPSVQPLSRLRPGRRATVAALTGGREFQSRLLSMGLKIGSEVEVLRSSNSSGGPTLLAAGPMRLAIGRGMAEKILVTVRVEGG